MARLVALALAILVAISFPGAPLARAQDQGSGSPPGFILGVNYEGPADRAWQMWDEGKWDPGLVAKDLDRAKAANLSVVRVFVQRSLVTDVRAGRWGKLDTFLRLAEERGLKVILTFADYAEIDVARLAAVAGAIAAHTKDSSTVLAYDLKNEPHFGDLALAIYPPGVDARLQDPAVVPEVGETLKREDVPAYRASDRGRREIPARLSDEQAYVYANVVAAYREMLAASTAWNATHRATIVDYVQSPDAARWRPLLDALNATLGAWMKPQLDAVRAVDATHPITLAQVDAVIGSLPVNAWLDYRTFHTYARSATTAGINTSMALFDAVRAAVPGKPLVLGEFGFSNATLDEQLTARLEAQTVQAVREHGGAGALKWMLNDFPQGFNARENNLGMYRGDGLPKPVVAAIVALGPFDASRALLPPAPARVEDSPFFAQYCPGAPRWLCRPDELPHTDLTNAFEPG